MMKWVFTLLILLSVVFGIGCGRMQAVGETSLAECGRAVQLALTLAGSMALWSGLMKVAQESGLTQVIARLLSPLTSRIFWDIPRESDAMQAITMNITANLLGLGNAATPLGIRAMTELSRQMPPGERTATDSMVLFTLLNTASIQLVPTTIAVLRLQYGAAAPLDILPAILLVSPLALLAGLIPAMLLNRRKSKH